MKVYIASPYGSKNKNIREANVYKAMEVADKVLEAGHAPFLPHLYYFWHEKYPHERKEWMSLDGVWLSQCDALIRVPGYSPGADVEVDLAKRFGLCIFYGVEDFLAGRLNVLPNQLNPAWSSPHLTSRADVVKLMDLE